MLRASANESCISILSSRSQHLATIELLLAIQQLDPAGAALVIAMLLLHCAKPACARGQGGRHLLGLTDGCITCKAPFGQHDSVLGWQIVTEFGILFFSLCGVL